MRIIQCPLNAARVMHPAGVRFPKPYQITGYEWRGSANNRTPSDSQAPRIITLARNLDVDLANISRVPLDTLPKIKDQRWLIIRHYKTLKEAEAAARMENDLTRHFAEDEPEVFRYRRDFYTKAMRKPARYCELHLIIYVTRSRLKGSKVIQDRYLIIDADGVRRTDPAFIAAPVEETGPL